MMAAPQGPAGQTPLQDSDYETDEECLVHVSVSGILQEDLSLLAPSQFSFIDISSSRPLVTIGGQAFVGDFQDTAGSSVFFSRDEVTEERDQVFSRQPASKVKYLASTRKKLELKRVFLNKKPAGKAGTSASGTVSESEPQKPPVS